MKTKILIFALAISSIIAASNTLLAQHGPKHNFKWLPREVIVKKILDDLSTDQRNTLVQMSKENRERMDKYRKELKSLNDSIMMLRKKDGNNSEILFPLVDRLYKLEAEKDKSLYLYELKIDSILTAEQKIKIDEYEEKMRQDIKEHADKMKKKCENKKHKKPHKCMENNAENNK
ncbi:MAG: hypothetical protein IKY43_06515 [Bacteroidales bacterium]|nr:hypothetical protein [Bacteroidales bacterium]